jgi:hypothetical protein
MAGHRQALPVVLAFAPHLGALRAFVIVLLFMGLMLFGEFDVK